MKACCRLQACRGKQCAVQPIMLFAARVLPPKAQNQRRHLASCSSSKNTDQMTKRQARLAPEWLPP